jgi:hypothetical protein
LPVDEFASSWAKDDAHAAVEQLNVIVGLAELRRHRHVLFESFQLSIGPKLTLLRRNHLTGRGIAVCQSKKTTGRNPMTRYEHARAAERSDGVGVELGGLLVVAIVAMGLLALGYHSHAGSTVSESSGPNNQLATDRNNPNTPKPYQPQNPAPDTRSAPTGSSTGAGADSGGHPEASPKE